MDRTSVHPGGVFGHLSRALFLAGLLHSVRHHTALSTATQETPTKKCESGQIEVSLTPLELAVKLECSSGSQLFPSEYFNALAYSDGKCGEQGTALDDLLDDGEGTINNTELVITKLPTEEKRLCYQCKSGGAVTCSAVITVASLPKSCMASEAVGRHMQARSTDLVLELKGTTPVFFSCPDGDTLDPSGNDEVYVGDDCGTKSSRTDVERKGGSENGYSFKMNKAPTQQETFCYKCKKSDGAIDDCMVKIKTVPTITIVLPPDDDLSSGAAVTNYVSGHLCMAALWLGFRFLNGAP
ncbi:SAG-related sequence SRS27B [Toxoplasma gondii GT1]|uniref:SAG-related sequence SRS27B n=2 Tax=Toxoplasma gondii TaxID=5811 RepID=S7WEY7_TOXGG|nr:SAG-related sequence SRS27B [Toxoplasma gondii GT1]KAF4641313.1 SAG-related sequence SRS27B [Toxoplasma gondii]